MSDDDKIAALQQSLEQNYNKMDTTVNQPWSAGLVEILGGSLLLLCITVLCIGAFLLRGKEVDNQVILKMFGLTLILCLSAFLMVTGYGQAQLTPIIGLFGAIAGYLLGKDTKMQVSASTDENPRSPEAEQED